MRSYFQSSQPLNTYNILGLAGEHPHISEFKKAGNLCHLKIIFLLLFLSFSDLSGVSLSLSLSGS